MTFTIDAENNITAYATPEEAAAATATPFDSFSSQKELGELAKAWPAERLVAIWNSLPGVTAVESFKSAQAATSWIWKQIQSLGEAAQPEAEPAKAKAGKKAKGGAQSAKGAAGEGEGGEEGCPRRGRAQSQESRQDEGRRRAA